MSYVYVVQDHEREIRGVWSSLALARDVFVQVTTELMTLDEFQEYQQLLDSGEPDMWGPWVIVYDVDRGSVWSYESIDEIDAAIKDGEQYDD